MSIIALGATASSVDGTKIPSLARVSFTNMSYAW